MIDLRFDRVSKRYLIPHEAEDSASRQSWIHNLRSLWRPPAEFWAVRDVSFEVKRGEALGIIGSNGAGKSTILKLLASITTPSAGEITINGRAAALIEVGSGFHPDLTGRENVYLSGSILGMTRSEIGRKLESIIDFAEIGEFIDIPVKRYSSGMYVRLGFAIAAHLEPEILLLDEVLAVGDMAFQRKCFDRVRALQREGRTIIFISHDLIAVEALCDRVLLMQHGEVIADGPPGEVIGQYKALATKGATPPFTGIGSVREWRDLDAPGDGVVRLRRVRVCGEDGAIISTADIRHPVGIEITYDVLEGGHVLVPIVHFFNEARLHLFTVLDLEQEWQGRSKSAGRYVSTAWIPGNFLAEGSVIVDTEISTLAPHDVHAHGKEVHAHGKDVVTVRVFDPMSANSARGGYTGPFPGAVRPLVSWNTYVSCDGSGT
jgi:lipopolysaccharide transport system ATP-binding protein